MFFWNFNGRWSKGNAPVNGAFSPRLECFIGLREVFTSQKTRMFGENFWALSQYLSFTMTLFLAHAISCELALVLLYLVHFQVITPNFLFDYRRHAIILSFILGALLTPPDVMTQVALASFFIVTYETAIIYAKLRAYQTSHNQNYEFTAG